MGDPFITFERGERLKAGLLLLVLLAFLAAVIIPGSRMRNFEGNVVEGRVERFSPADKYGYMVVAVRLSDGSIREVSTQFRSVSGCKRGDRIALVQHGNALRIGVKGCNSPA